MLPEECKNLIIGNGINPSSKANIEQDDRYTKAPPHCEAIVEEDISRLDGEEWLQFQQTFLCVI